MAPACRARHARAQVDAEELKRREAEDKERRQREEAEEAERQRRQAEEDAAAQAKYEQEKAAWEAAEKIRLTAEATDQLQEALLTQDPPTLRAAISAYGPILEEAGESAKADLQVRRAAGCQPAPTRRRRRAALAASPPEGVGNAARLRASRCASDGPRAASVDP